jgi:hypothetical protein
MSTVSLIPAGAEQAEVDVGARNSLQDQLLKFRRQGLREFGLTLKHEWILEFSLEQPESLR